MSLCLENKIFCFTKEFLLLALPCCRAWLSGLIHIHDHINMQRHTAASSFTALFTLIGNCGAEQIISLMTSNICYTEGTLLLTMTVQPSCNSLLTVGRSYTATYRET